jgi:hypothetical protein
LGLDCYYCSSCFVGVRSGWPHLGRAYQYFGGRCLDFGNYLASAASEIEKIDYRLKIAPDYITESGAISNYSKLFLLPLHKHRHYNMDIVVGADGFDDAGATGTGGLQHDLGFFNNI